MIWLLLLAVVLMAARLAWLVWGPRRHRDRYETVSTMIVLGSGGHTAEMLTLLKALDHRRYTPRCFVVAATDRLGVAKVQAFERQLHRARTQRVYCGNSKAETTANVEIVPRSREVGQSYLTSVFTTLRALSAAFGIVWRHSPQLLLVNGPGTCIPLCAAALIFRFCGVVATRIVYTESIARVRSLSLSGQILYHCRAASAFVVQWSTLQAQYTRSQFHGRLY